MVAAMVPTGHRQSRTAPERDQDARGNAGGRPEHGDAVGLGQQREAQPRRQEIGGADRDGENERAEPPRCVGNGVCSAGDPLLAILQHALAPGRLSHMARDNANRRGSGGEPICGVGRMSGEAA
jgi:hypothetical protein